MQEVLNYIDEPIVLKDDSIISKISATANIFEQEMHRDYNFSVQFQTIVKDQRGDIAPTVQMKVTYLEDYPASTYMDDQGGTITNRVRENAMEFMKAVKKTYESKVEGDFPFKFDRVFDVRCEEAGFRKYRYFCTLLFEMI